MSSIRTENWLDGMEDYEYLKLLEQRIERLRAAGKTAQPQRLAAELHPHASPGNEVVRSKSEYATTPEVVEQARRRLARLILGAGRT